MLHFPRTDVSDRQPAGFLGREVLIREDNRRVRKKFFWLENMVDTKVWKGVTSCMSACGGQAFAQEDA